MNLYFKNPSMLHIICQEIKGILCMFYLYTLSIGLNVGDNKEMNSNVSSKHAIVCILIVVGLM